jgi:hypothetical protein
MAAESYRRKEEWGSLIDKKNKRREMRKEMP